MSVEHVFFLFVDLVVLVLKYGFAGKKKKLLFLIPLEL